MPERTVCKVQLIRYRISVVLSVGAIMVTLQGYSMFGQKDMGALALCDMSYIR